jgi:hypothetical protein
MLTTATTEPPSADVGLQDALRPAAIDARRAVARRVVLRVAMVPVRSIATTGHGTALAVGCDALRGQRRHQVGRGRPLASFWCTGERQS